MKIFPKLQSGNPPFFPSPEYLAISCSICPIFLKLFLCKSIFVKTPPAYSFFRKIIRRPSSFPLQNNTWHFHGHTARNFLLSSPFIRVKCRTPPKCHYQNRNFLFFSSCKLPQASKINLMIRNFPFNNPLHIGIVPATFKIYLSRLFLFYFFSHTVKFQRMPKYNLPICKLLLIFCFIRISFLSFAQNTEDKIQKLLHAPIIFSSHKSTLGIFMKKYSDFCKVHKKFTIVPVAFSDIPSISNTRNQIMNTIADFFWSYRIQRMKIQTRCMIVVFFQKDIESQRYICQNALG